ncbi:precorrin-6A/cobalt-precorrin-6A reductase [Silvimonas terrae]|uniref:Precorrin-6A/cobalt-precorrin-6A reductase n=1 Tax=Silvimonas terrae TaxID=300266 RepID=A0A840RBY5_9NEIS|nr:cobalt-precorrin-6A reductase [Silvimonas terrae]MBB5190959.1 precorrin-6A/cobalt-precorrin-6A reductase [Silvimonas terrae]
MSDAARILLLGGTGDALHIARHLGPRHVYSLAGLGRVPDDLACQVRVGGFGGADGLAQYLIDANIALVLDATHPYAAQISGNAARACTQTGVSYWALRRAPWQAGAGDDWRNVADWADLMAQLAPFKRPLFTSGREPLAHLDDIPPHQHWLVRCLDPHPGNARAQILGVRGPFTADGERALLHAHQIDVIVSKNSGGAATEAKLEAARELGLPVLMFSRPALPPAQREFTDLAALLLTLKSENLA